jgi:hypothetical protein
MAPAALTDVEQGSLNTFSWLWFDFASAASSDQPLELVRVSKQA